MIIVDVDGFRPDVDIEVTAGKRLRKAIYELPAMTEPAPTFGLVWGQTMFAFVSGIESHCYEGGLVRIKSTTPEDDKLLVLWGNHLLPHANVWLEACRGSGHIIRWGMEEKFPDDLFEI